MGYSILPCRFSERVIESVTDNISSNRVGNSSDIRIMLLVGEVMPRVFKGETSMLEHFRESGLLDEYYAHGFGTMQSAQWLGNAVKQLTDRNPHLNFLEIGKRHRYLGPRRVSNNN